MQALALYQLLYPVVLALYLAIKKSNSSKVSLSYCLRITICTEHSYTQIDKDVPSHNTVFKMFHKYLA